MRRIRYQVACSLDGYIAGPQGEYDWITGGDDFDFAAHFRQFDTLLMGRNTFELIPPGQSYEQKMVVVSRTLSPADHPNITIISNNVGEAVQELRSQPGKDIWLFGGGELFRTLLELELVDTVELAMVPILLGGGIPFLPAPAVRRRLQLSNHHAYQGSMMMLNYDVLPAEKTKRAARNAPASLVDQP